MTDRSQFFRRVKRLIERLLLIVVVWLMATMAAGLALGPWAGGLVTLATVGWGAWEVYRMFARPISPRRVPPAVDK